MKAKTIAPRKLVLRVVYKVYCTDADGLMAASVTIEELLKRRLESVAVLADPEPGTNGARTIIRSLARLVNVRKMAR